MKLTILKTLILDILASDDTIVIKIQDHDTRETVYRHTINFKED